MGGGGYVNVQMYILQGQVRMLRGALESRYGQRLESDDELVPWLVRMRPEY